MQQVSTSEFRFPWRRSEVTIGGGWGLVYSMSGYMANRIRKATIRQNRPIASDKAKPRIA